MMPSLSSKIYQNHFSQDLLKEHWPIIDQSLLIEDKIKLPIQINGKLAEIILTKKDYVEEQLLEEIYKIEKIKKNIDNKKIKKIINVQNKIINIIAV